MMCRSKKWQYVFFGKMLEVQPHLFSIDKFNLKSSNPSRSICVEKMNLVLIRAQFGLKSKKSNIIV